MPRSHLAGLLLALGSALPATPAGAQAPDCDARSWLALEGHGEVACAAHAGGILAAGVTDIDSPRPVLRLATYRDGALGALVEVPLRDLYPDPPDDMALAAGDASVLVTTLAPQIHRVSILFGDGEDSRSVRELAVLVRVSRGGERASRLYVGWAETLHDERGQCVQERSVRFAVGRRHVVERAHSRRRFHDTGEFDSPAHRSASRRACLAGSARPAERIRHRIVERPLPPPDPALSDWLEALEETPPEPPAAP